MNTLLLLPVLAIAFIASSCRTAPLLDPMTMKPSCRCLPENFHPKHFCSEETVTYTK